MLGHLPTKLGDFVGANLGNHIPAPCFAYGYDESTGYLILIPDAPRASGIITFVILQATPTD